MQHLKEKWLKVLNVFYAAGSLAMVIAYGYFAYQQQTLVLSGKEFYGVNIFSAIIAFLCLVYYLIFQRFIKRYNMWLSYLIPYALYAVMLSAAIESSITSQYSYLYIGFLSIVICFSVAYGYVVALSSIAIILLISGMEIAGNTTPSIVGLKGDLIINLARVSIATILLIIFLLTHQYEESGDMITKNYIERYFVNNDVIRMLTDSISDGIIITDKNGIIKSINPGAAQILQQDLKDLSDLDFRSVLKLQDPQHKDLSLQQNPIALALNSQKSQSQELILILKNKRELFIDIMASAIQNKSTKEVYGCVVILRDVSKKRKEEEARSEFISTASHEMRTPVAAIEGYLALALNENVAKIDDKAREFLQKAHMSTEHLGRLFQDLLVSAKAEDGRLVSHPDVIEMGSFLEQVTDDLKLITAKKGLGLEYITGSGENASAGDKSHAIRPLYYTYADQDRLREIITNLFDNAVKYTDKGKITIGLTGNGDVVQFFVRDTGAGIPPEDVPHLFQKFYRVDNSTTRTKGGTGLGLFISRKILELYGGRIWVESELSKGSTFYVNLPRIDSAKAANLKSQVSSPSAFSIGGNDSH